MSSWRTDHTFPLYAESGPNGQTNTMVHVLDLLGCTAEGPTTKQAVDATPRAIWAYLRFLKRHGEDLNASMSFRTPIREHVIKGAPGAAPPPDGLPPDFKPLSGQELLQLTQRVRWTRDELWTEIRRRQTDLVRPRSRGQRSLAGIVEHVAHSSGTYLTNVVGRVDGLAEANRLIRATAGGLDALKVSWAINIARWERLDDGERTASVRRGDQTWTARRGLRRVLEHEWEHLQEIQRRPR